MERSFGSEGDSSLEEDSPRNESESEREDTPIVDYVGTGMTREPSSAFKATAKADTRKKVSFHDEFDDCAWVTDVESDEVFLSAEKYEIPNVSWPKLRIPSKLFERLYCHQKVGVQWMASLHNSRIGGILGDDMGMGKTYQTLAYLGGLMRAHTIRNALVVAPLSVLQSWEKEARLIMERSCVPKVTIIVVSSDMPKHRRCDIVQQALSW